MCSQAYFPCGQKFSDVFFFFFFEQSFSWIQSELYRIEFKAHSACISNTSHTQKKHTGVSLAEDNLSVRNSNHTNTHFSSGSSNLLPPDINILSPNILQHPIHHPVHDCMNEMWSYKLLCIRGCFCLMNFILASIRSLWLITASQNKPTNPTPLQRGQWDWVSFKYK